jgi:hypothetical protein
LDLGHRQTTTCRSENVSAKPLSRDRLDTHVRKFLVTPKREDLAIDVFTFDVELRDEDPMCDRQPGRTAAG